MFVGGEFFYDEGWLLAEARDIAPGALFLNGGTACLRVIGDFLRDQGVRRVALPEYLCPVIVSALERQGLECVFYALRPDLSIELEDAARKAGQAGALLFINYFGFQPGEETQAFLRGLQATGVWLIEDHAQGGPVINPLGDFAFNSLRKFSPYDGGYLISRFDLRPYLAQYPPGDGKRLELARAYRGGLGDYLLRGKGSHRALARLYREAERAYEAEPRVSGDAQERAALERLDWERIRRARRANYALLEELLRWVPEVRPVLPGGLPETQPGATPLGLPVYLEAGERGAVLSRLARAQIGATVHWDALRTHPRTRGNPRAAQMAREMLTLPVDPRAGRREMEYLTLELVRATAGR